MKEFLEEEKLKFCLSGIENDGGRFIDFDGTVEWIENHDTRLINKVLSEVKTEVEKKKGILWNDDEQKHRKNIIRYDLILEILELIDQLKLK